MTLKHTGEIKMLWKNPKIWAPSFEEYYLKENNGITLLTIITDNASEDFEVYFSKPFPPPLAIVKQLTVE